MNASNKKLLIWIDNIGMIYRPYQSNVNIMAENMLSVRMSTRVRSFYAIINN